MSWRAPAAHTMASSSTVRGVELYPTGRHGLTVHDGLVDEVAIARVMRGVAQGGAPMRTLNYAERREVVARLRERRWTPEFIAGWVGSASNAIERYVALIEAGPWAATPPGSP